MEMILDLDGTDTILSNLGAGPLEDLLVVHGDKFIDRVELLARQDRQFRKSLGIVWKNNVRYDLDAREGG
jgi:hypothetical protein